MMNIIIPEEDIEKYHHRIDKQNEICPIPVQTDKGEVYTLPVCVFNLAGIDIFFDKLLMIGEVDMVLKDMPIQDIKIKEVTAIDIKK